MPKINYSGSQAAFSFDGVQIGKGQTIDVSVADLKRISKGKAFSALLESGDITIGEEAKQKSSAGGKGSNENKLDDALANVKAELTEMGITFADDEAIEQLQAKLVQAKE
ncbi:hypothetical protein [Acinetobacter sp. ANC 3832]|uniref:hypothetical protein n=1 Tax=Acinetobacter sp. ANC 3832 TaxID=1977874 RepID=UPI000A344F9E|nr:hypothetical protein [Acinetobacter sp. ANC 3832]OTG94996.1 hypothetical protein B9T35_06450 [Acinetobacter sp. ANC 3832]